MVGSVHRSSVSMAMSIFPQAKEHRRMAQQRTVILTDDNDGGKAVETVEFGLDG